MMTSPAGNPALAALVLVCLVSAGPVGAADETGTHVDQEPGTEVDLRQDVIAYQQMFDVTLREATRRMELHDVLRSLMAEMQVLAPDRFAGSWIEHEPDYVGVVAFVGVSAETSSAQALARSSGLPINVKTDAQFTVDELHAGLDRILPVLHADPRQIASELDVIRGRVLLSSEEPLAQATLDALRERAAVPVDFELGPAPVDLHTYGGKRLTVGITNHCTTGFTVRNTSTNVRGVLTAGHCNDSLTYWQSATISYTLALMGVRDDADQDAQWMRSEEHDHYDDFWDGDSYRDVAGVTTRANADGDFVCHVGIGSNPFVAPFGYSCGVVTSIAADPDTCFTPDVPDACDDVWVKVEGPNLACYGGDSGGPVFSNFSAYGILKAGASTGKHMGECQALWFMSQDFLAGMTLAIATS